MTIETLLTVPDRDDCDRLLETLPSLPLAARAAVVERLMRNPSPDIRERALRIGAAVLSDSRLTELLRADEDAVMRNAGSEILLLRGGRSLTAVLPLLHDPDPDIALQAVLIVDRLRDPRALEALHAVLAHADSNVVREAILAIGRLGDRRSVPHLLPFLDGELWPQMAALQALGDLRCPEAIAPLARRITDPVVGSLVAEALARIGGPTVFAVLADNWVNSPAGELDEDRTGLLAHVLEGLPAPPESTPGLRDKLVRCLRGGTGSSSALQSTAARCLLCLGPGPWDEDALALLAAAQPSAEFVPEPLRRRLDLIVPLLCGGETERSWGFLLAAQNPDQIRGRMMSDVFLGAVQAAGRGGEPVSAALVAALDRVRVPGLGGALVDLYLRLPAEERTALEAGLPSHAAAVRATVAMRTDLDALSRLRLAALGGEPAEGLAAQILALAAAERREAASGLVHLEALMRRLPWEEWLAEEPELFTDLAAEVAARYGLHGLAAPLRARLAAAPSAAVIRALGELRDRDSSPDLVHLVHLAGRRPDLTPVLLEALGRIGGDVAREVLRRVALAGGPDARLGFKALAACHERAELPLFRDAATHGDWFIRLAAAEVLARSMAAEDVALLARLVGDSVALVSQRALTLLEAGRGEHR